MCLLWCFPQGADGRAPFLAVAPAVCAFQALCITLHPRPPQLFALSRPALPSPALRSLHTGAALHPPPHLSFALPCSNPICPPCRHRQLFGLFDVVVTGDMVARGKPAPDIFMQASKQGA